MNNKDRPINVITDDTTIGQMGLTKREYFAAVAMQGIISREHSFTQEEVAEDAVTMADLLLEELNKQQ